MSTINQQLIAQKLLLDIQCTAQFASKNIQENFILDNVVTDLYSLIEKLHLCVTTLQINATPKPRG